MCQAYTEVTNHLHISSQGEIKTTHRCSGSLNKQKAALPAGPSCPIDQPVAQRVAPEETCESIFRQKSTITALDPLLSFCPLLSNVGMLLKPCGCHFLFCFIFRAPPARTRERWVGEILFCKVLSKRLHIVTHFPNIACYRYILSKHCHTHIFLFMLIWALGAALLQTWQSFSALFYEDGIQLCDK